MSSFEVISEENRLYIVRGAIDPVLANDFRDEQLGFEWDKDFTSAYSPGVTGRVMTVAEIAEHCPATKKAMRAITPSNLQNRDSTDVTINIQKPNATQTWHRHEPHQKVTRILYGSEWTFDYIDGDSDTEDPDEDPNQPHFSLEGSAGDILIGFAFGDVWHRGINSSDDVRVNAGLGLPF